MILLLCPVTFNQKVQLFASPLCVGHFGIVWIFPSPFLPFLGWARITLFPSAFVFYLVIRRFPASFSKRLERQLDFPASSPSPFRPSFLLDYIKTCCGQISPSMPLRIVERGWWWNARLLLAAFGRRRVSCSLDVVLKSWMNIQAESCSASHQ